MKKLIGGPGFNHVVEARHSYVLYNRAVKGPSSMRRNVQVQGARNHGRRRASPGVTPSSLTTSRR